MSAVDPLEFENMRRSLADTRSDVFVLREHFENLYRLNTNEIVNLRVSVERIGDLIASKTVITMPARHETSGAAPTSKRWSDRAKTVGNR